mmetsp:Transcript_3069/g.5362  ORF Transcript_3069/g.5362 Transcript_3069/m.5362 type:complete len:617 (+) Transcript_3069:79-1929(+)|eukprot:CAMPEP_0194683306 /NCGR_PEP_ID=MMETSP0295-20121207/13340_1 /TAXON_ID=39354 /ORGANISM="Heterosigma akashiwo, Strain CCMP2393" /LENGTH=616 /DNA_ID=CAMNT_0039569937 /DNA_START=84 /DNA_END=1934 /DNA_ORIENTATION=-
MEPLTFRLRSIWIIPILWFIFGSSIVVIGAEDRTQQHRNFDDVDVEFSNGRSLEELKRLLRTENGTITRPPVFLFPGIASTRLISWKTRECMGPNINVMDSIWINFQKVLGSLTIDPACWLECMSLGPDQRDPDHCRVRADEGLKGIMELSGNQIVGNFLGITVFEWLIKYLADEYGYDGSSLFGMGYDWRLSPGRLQQRDKFFTRLKARLEEAAARHRRPAVLVAHSMGNHVLDYFFRWARRDMGRAAFERWVTRHVWAHVGLSAPLLGASNPLKCVLSGEGFGLGITDEQARRMELTLGSTLWNLPRPTVKVPPEDIWRPQGWRLGEDWHSDLVTIRSLYNASEKVVFGASPASNGDLLEWFAKEYNDSDLMLLRDNVHRWYRDDPDVRPFDEPMDRPPPRHVLFAYGVNLTTEVGYRYAKDPDLARPVLEELLWERPEDLVLVRAPGTKGAGGQRTLRDNPLRRSGDQVVSYLSLSWAQTWLGETLGRGGKVVSVATGEEKLFSSPYHAWVFPQRTAPATLRLSSQDPQTGRSTTVLEVAGANHREITSDPFTVRSVVDSIFELVNKEMCLRHPPEEDSEEEAEACTFAGPREERNWLWWLLGGNEEDPYEEL